MGEQAKANKKTMNSINQLLYYCASHPDATVRFHASDMILNIHSNESYLNAPHAQSQIASNFFLESLLQLTVPIKLNGVIHVI